MFPQRFLLKRDYFATNGFLYKTLEEFIALTKDFDGTLLCWSVDGYYHIPVDSNYTFSRLVVIPETLLEMKNE